MQFFVDGHSINLVAQPQTDGVVLNLTHWFVTYFGFSLTNPHPRLDPQTPKKGAERFERCAVRMSPYGFRECHHELQARLQAATRVINLQCALPLSWFQPNIR